MPGQRLCLEDDKRHGLGVRVSDSIRVSCLADAVKPDGLGHRKGKSFAGYTNKPVGLFIFGHPNNLTFGLRQGLLKLYKCYSRGGAPLFFFSGYSLEEFHVTQTQNVILAELKRAARRTKNIHGTSHCILF